MPSTIERVHREFAGEGLVVLAVSLSEDRERVGLWVRRHGISPTVLLDTHGAVASAYRVRSIPTVVLVGRDGSVRHRAVGTQDWTGETERARLRGLLAD